MELNPSVLNDLNRFMDLHDGSDVYHNAIVRRTRELLESECTPFSPKNWLEAFTDISDEAKLGILNGIRTGQFTYASAILMNAITEVWIGIARDRAIEQIGNSNCFRCYDEGCQTCDSDFGERE